MRHTTCIALTAGLLTGCLNVCAHGAALSGQLDAGRGSISLDGSHLFEPREFAWSGGWTPTSTPHSAAFAFLFTSSSGEQSNVSCDPDWPTLASGPMAVVTAGCVVTADQASSQPLTEGTITATPVLDSSGNGTVTITLALPSQSFGIPDANHVGVISATSLTGTATFGDVSCPSGFNLY
jgi:hypothetical protein